MAIALTFY